jgi:pyridoxamine-phosphate oxidase
MTLTGDEDLLLPEFDRPPADPVALLRDWVWAAEERGVREPLAVTLATAGADGRPSSRTVIVKAVDARGLVFATAEQSRKGRDIAATGWAAGTLYWRETLQQVNVAGTVERTTAAESDDLFHDRAPSSQAATAASHQSEVLEDEDALRAAVDALLATDAPIERPAGWGGYRLLPERVEFWHGRRDRVHRRLAYELEPSGAWVARRLQP